MDTGLRFTENSAHYHLILCSSMIRPVQIWADNLILNGCSERRKPQVAKGMTHEEKRRSARAYFV